LKQSLPSAYILSCLGGNDFAILVPPFQYKRATLFGINKLCQELQQHLQSTFHILNTPISLTACIGIAVYPDNGYDSESLMASAESALHYAKELGPNNYQFYKRTIKKRIKSSLSIENEIVQAIENNDFILYYQPKFNLNSQQVEGAEALVRWPDEQGNIRPPSYFIDICEQNNSIVPLTKNLLEIACKQLVTWREQGISLNGPLALNMSAVHFQNSELVQELSVLLAKYQLDPSLLELEITETVMMKSPEFAQKQMEQIKSLGIKIALDDFGVGHSSLNYLKHFPIDKLKIDRSFICDIEHSTQGLNITATIIRLAKYLGLDVVAEGVENQQQAYLLNGMGCPVIQGFYYSKPIPASQLESLLMQQKKMLKSRD
jgi:EAL domain-containing protein (putative c-di-GMP-specific phosphodiesterase class I)